jgi:hypothetical protein
MALDSIGAFVRQVKAEHLRETVFHLAKHPLPYRNLNYTVPGHAQNTLYEADAYLQARLEGWGYGVEREGTQVQAFRCDSSKPKSQQYSAPMPDDPWYNADNLYVRRPGIAVPEETIVVISHKDSPSWVDSPGAYDNAVGTAGNLELARVLAGYASRRTLWFIWCNEEHTPWTSATAATGSRERGEDIIAVLNLDGLGAKSAEVEADGRKTSVTLFTEPAGEAIADLVGDVIADYRIPLEHSKYRRPTPGDDDGSFIRAGYPAAVLLIGSYPYGNPDYHAEGDIPERVDYVNAALQTQAALAAILTLDQTGA